MRGWARLAAAMAVAVALCMCGALPVFAAPDAGVTAPDIEARRQALVGKLETELADTLLAFLSDALGSDIDLSAQATSLTKLLEAHKDELLEGAR